LKKSEIPKFGVLEGVKVVHATLSTAGPFAAQLMADFGAEVLWIESPVMPDFARGRGASGMLAESERLNQRTLSLNIPSPEGRRVFLRILKDADIFIETSKGGQYVKWGLTDDVLWEVNPKLVIVHISGFGQDGIREYVTRPSCDSIAQAFGCYTQLNGLPDSPPVPAYPYTADYMTALFASTSALAALHKAKETGAGESIDLAQYEVIMRVQGLYPMEFLNLGIKPLREAAHSAHAAGVGSYACKDGKTVVLLYMGADALKRGLPLLDLRFGSEMFPSNSYVVQSNTQGAELLETRLKEFLKSHTAAEADALFRAAGVPSSIVYDYEMALQDPQYEAREVFVEWSTVEGKPLKGINIFPKFKRYPNRIWRGLPYIGMDNDDVLHELGISDKQIQQLYESGVLLKVPPQFTTSGFPSWK
jgi:L-carnitine CoA-transferase